VAAIKGMISSSTTLWENSLAGTVLKYNEKIAAKIISVGKGYAEYSSLQYLEAYAPEIPAPKPHGLIKYSNFYIMLMTYIPSTTLESVWPTLDPNNKVAIQARLQTIFTLLRTLKKPSGYSLGGVRGEGVQDFHMDDHDRQHLNTVSQFEDFQFSVNTLPPSSAFVSFRRSFLPTPNGDCFFAHGDVRPANIMVEQDYAGRYIVSGIID
jgi:aminoglycoside phosphotransferase (APT) family kinase protein